MITRNGKAVAVLLVPNGDDDLNGSCSGDLRAFKQCLPVPGRASRKGRVCRRRFSKLRETTQERKAEAQRSAK